MVLVRENNMYDNINKTNVNSLAPDVVDALMPPATAMLDYKRAKEERPELRDQYNEPIEMRRIRACCPHRKLSKTEEGIDVLSQSESVMKDGTVRCSLCGARLLTHWSQEDFKKKIEDCVAVLDTILAYGPNFNLGNYPPGYVGERGVLDRIIECKEFLTVNMIKISETFNKTALLENNNQENNRTLGRNYRDHTSNVSSWG